MEFLKNLLFKEDERDLLPYQFKYLNRRNMTSTKKYLDLLLLKDFYVKKPQGELNDILKEKR